MGAALSAIALAVSLKARTEVERTTSAIEATRARFLAAGAAELSGVVGGPSEDLAPPSRHVAAMLLMHAARE
jgi:hypothetical protein